MLRPCLTTPLALTYNPILNVIQNQTITSVSKQCTVYWMSHQWWAHTHLEPTKGRVMLFHIFFNFSVLGQGVQTPSVATPREARLPYSVYSIHRLSPSSATFVQLFSFFFFHSSHRDCSEYGIPLSQGMWLIYFLCFCLILAITDLSSSTLQAYTEPLLLFPAHRTQNIPFSMRN